MEIISITLALSNIGAGILAIAACIPLLRKRIGMNHWYGFRFRKSFSSDEHWYAINRYGAKRMIFWSVVIITVGVVGLVIPSNNNEILWIGMSGAPALLIIPALESWILAKKLSR